MGLYDRVISYIQNKHPGLLKLAENELENNPAAMFNTITRKMNIQKACIIVRNDDLYRFFLSTGFSNDTLSESVSTADFWDGTLPHQEWISVVHEQASSFLQLFSKDDISDISKLHIKRFSVSDIHYIFIAAETDHNNQFQISILDSLIDSFTQFISKKHG